MVNLVFALRGQKKVYLLFETGEIWANNCHYQEISTGEENHTSHGQFKSTKLLHKPLIQIQPREPQRGKKMQPKESPTLLIVRLTGYGGSSTCHSLPQIFLPRLIVQTVPLLCYILLVVVVGRKSERSERS